MKYRALKLIGLGALVLLMACRGPVASPDDGESTQIAAAGSVTVIELTNMSQVLLQVEEEIITQNNCGGNAEVANQITKTRTVGHTLKVGGEYEINLNGEVGIPGNTVNVELGATVAANFGYEYGQSESISQSITVMARGGTYVQHIIILEELWEIGTARIKMDDDSLIEIPFQFRIGFSIRLLESKELNEICPIDVITSSPSPLVPTPTLSDSMTITMTPLQPSPTNPLPSQTPVPLPTTTPPIPPIPTVSTDTQPGTILMVGDSWTGNGLRVRLVKADFDGFLNMVELHYTITNISSGVKTFVLNEEVHFILQDETGKTYHWNHEYVENLALNSGSSFSNWALKEGPFTGTTYLITIDVPGIIYAQWQI